MSVGDGEGKLPVAATASSGPRHEHHILVHLHHALLLLALWTCGTHLWHTGKFQFQFTNYVGLCYEKMVGRYILLSFKSYLFLYPAVFHLLLVVVSTICSNVQGMQQYYRGQYDNAESTSRTAKTWTICGIVSGVIYIVSIVLIIIVGGAARVVANMKYSSDRYYHHD